MWPENLEHRTGRLYCRGIVDRMANTILDNKKNGKVGNDLGKHLTSESRLSVISGQFSMYGFEALKKELRRIKGLRLVLSQPPGSAESQFPGVIGDSFELRFRNQLNQTQVAMECAHWLAEKAEAKTVRNPSAFSQNLFHVGNQGTDDVAIQGNSQFTGTGLGYVESGNYYMNMCVSDPPNAAAMLEWFEAIWTDPDVVVDAKDLLLAQLENLRKDQAPEFVYFLTLYNIFKDFLEDIDEENIIKTKTGFKDTLIWNKLYRFQRDGVLGAI